MDSISKADYREYLIQQAAWLYACCEANDSTEDMRETLRATFVAYCIMFNLTMEEHAEILAELSSVLGGLDMKRFSKYMFEYYHW